MNMARKHLRRFSLFINTRFVSTKRTLDALFSSNPAAKFKKKENVGLFETPELSSPEGFKEIENQCLLNNEKLICEALSTSRTRKMVEIFDEISDNICKVADLAEFIRLAHPDRKFSQAAECTCISISKIVEKLNTNYPLYTNLKKVLESKDILPTTPIDDHVSQLFLFDFEQSGIHLTQNDKNKIIILNDEILQLGQQFTAGSMKARKIKSNVFASHINTMFVRDGNDIYVYGLCSDSAIPLMREMAYKIYLSHDEEQDNILTQLLTTRNDLARVCGFNTYAERALRGSTMETPEAVNSFIDSLSENLREYAERDFKIMERIKKDETSNFGKLSPWDVPYYKQKTKKKLFNVVSSDYMAYFSLGACMEGLNNLFNSLFGIRMNDVDVQNGEVWAPDVFKLSVTHESEGLLGYIYCDFYEREDKPNQDCHFTIRGGKMLPSGEYQTPIVVIMLNITKPKWSNPALLTPCMLGNLFHEMGHAMHSMLGRTQYQHVTGTRCSTDFAEVPSILLEYFASDERVLKSFAKHFRTNETIPEDMLKNLLASKKLFAASDLQMQIFYSALDQVYHGKHPLSGSTTDVLAEVQNKYYSLPYVPNTAWQLRFSHLVGYAAKYYSYLVSRSIASQIWYTYFEADPFNRDQGERYYRECLAHGGGKPTKVIVNEYLETDLIPERLAESIIFEINHDSKLHHINI